MLPKQNIQQNNLANLLWHYAGNPGKVGGIKGLKETIRMPKMDK